MYLFKPRAVDQVLEIALYAHLPAIKSSVPFGLPRCLSVRKAEGTRILVSIDSYAKVS